MKRFSGVSKYKLHEALFIVGFFAAAFLGSVLLSSSNDFPLIRGACGAIFLGLITAWYEIFISPILQKKLNTFLFMIATFIFYYMVFSVMLLLFSYVNLIFKVGLPFIEALKVNMLDIYPQGWHEMLFYYFMFVIILQLIRELRMKTGRGLTKNYLLGKLHNPLPEKRIFMFMDLTSSTNYAEKLGHEKYSSFIRDIYLELDEHIIAANGSLYQYVGDEVVISWSVKDGIKDFNCVKLFYAVSDRMNELKEYFHSKYGVVPKFKAGLNVGEVAITEVGGILKRELAFHGDVVNTASRICAECSKLNESLLLSKDLIVMIKNLDSKYGIQSVGNFNLRGKRNEIELFRVNLQNKADDIEEMKIEFNSDDELIKSLVPVEN